MYKLVISDDEGKTTIVPLIRDEVTIGRKEGNTIRLTDRNVSRFHARVTRENDLFRIEDLGSLTGTKVNNDLLKGKSQLVSTGDQISIGDYSVSIRTDVSSDVPLGRQIGPGDEAGIGKVTAHARLVMLTKPSPGQEFDLTSELYVMGRSGEANCRIPHSSVSRAHARLDYDGGKWTISDLDSVNGILINGSKKDDYVLKSADVIELGSVRIRFVAPGEPYTYDPLAAEAGAPGASASERPDKPKKMIARLVVAVMLGLVVLIAYLLLRNFPGGAGSGSDKAGDDGSGSGKPYAVLMEEGKDAMQAEKWAECAKIFNEVIEKNKDSKTAREWKKSCIMEADAKKDSERCAAASEKGSWKEAVEVCKRIPRSSRYYSLEKLQTASGKLCGQYIAGAQDAANRKDYATVVAILEQIGNIHEAPADCYDSEEKIWASIEKGADDQAVRELDAKQQLQKAPSNAEPRGPETRPAAGGTRPPSRAPKAPSNPYATNPYAVSGTANPYDTGGQQAGGAAGEGSESGSADLLSQAHTLVRNGDIRGAIAALEKGGDRRSVLALLAKLYMRVGNRSGYEKVAARFLTLFPNDPRSEQFRKDLGR